MHLLIDSPEFFNRLAAEEQLADIKELWLADYEHNKLFNRYFKALLENSSRRIADIMSEKNYVERALSSYKNKACLLTYEQLQRLDCGSLVVLTVPTDKINEFLEWAEANDYDCSNVAKHTVIDAVEYVIWRESNASL